jgi:predicted dehydrogenase
VIKWGVLGTGSIANTFIESIKTSKESELFGIASRSDKRAKKFSSLHNCLGFNAYDELLKQEDVNAIYVATTNNSHFSLTFQSLMNNKSVLCEKPLAMNASEVMILMDLARKKNLLLMEAFMYRMHSQTDKIKEIVISEFLNKEVLIDASFGFEASVDKDHRLLNPILGGGSILDVGCYPMSMSRMLIGIINGKSFSDPIDFKVN